MLKNLLKRRKAKRYYVKCLKMYQKHSICSDAFDMKLQDYWREQAKKAWQEYESLR